MSFITPIKLIPLATLIILIASQRKVIAALTFLSLLHKYDKNRNIYFVFVEKKQDNSNNPRTHNNRSKPNPDNPNRTDDNPNNPYNPNEPDNPNSPNDLNSPNNPHNPNNPNDHKKPCPSRQEYARGS